MKYDQENFLKISHALCKHNIWYFMEFPYKKRKYLYKSSKRRNHLKPENLETILPLSALKVSLKSVSSYQAEIKYLET